MLKYIYIYTYIYIYIYIYIYKAVELRSKLPTHCNLIGRSMTTPPPVLQPSSILPPPSSHCVFTPATKKSGGCFKNIISLFLLLQKNAQVGECRYLTAALRSSRKVATTWQPFLICFRNFPASNVLLETSYSDLGCLWFSSVFPSRCPYSTLDQATTASSMSFPIH